MNDQRPPVLGWLAAAIRIPQYVPLLLSVMVRADLAVNSSIDVIQAYRLAFKLSILIDHS